MTQFTNLANEFLAAEWELYPTRASALGIAEYDGRLEDLSADAFRRRDEEAASWLARFEAVADDGLSPDERLDRDLAIAQLRGRTILADWEGWRRDPLVYSTPCLDGIFKLLLHRLRSDDDLADSIASRLESVPGALAAGQGNLDPSLASRLIAERGVASARGGLRYLRELLPGEFGAGELRDRVVAAAAPAAAAFERWIEFLDRFVDSAEGDWQLGEERYTRLLKERESLADDARSLRGRGQAEYDRLDAEMRDLARTIDGSEDWVALLERTDEDHPPSEETMRAAYEDWTARSRAFLAETGLVTLPPGEQCVVEPSPVFQRPVLGVASYVAPPMYSDSTTGHFFVPFAPDGASDEEIQKRLKANSYGGIPTTAVHEAYPGHHWHLSMMKANPSRLRRAFGTPYFSEGWALYAERAMRERGFFTEPIHELHHLNATIFRAARIVVDTSLHLGEMAFEEAVRFMVEKAALPEPTARAEVGRYCWWPTQASAYLTGCLEILRIRERYLTARGVDSEPAAAPIDVLRDFHDAITSAGSLPLGLAERAVMGALPG
jgi:uncharacterized protein (DUF885 family)